MAGVYVHIPFCKKACHYCDFHFSTSLKRREEVLEAMRQEIFLRKDFLEGAEVSTVYFGGGTPSLLSPGELNRLLDALAEAHPLTRDCEITLEANPDDLDAANVAGLKATAVNRLSIGVQSFFDEDLRWMNRAHTGSEALDSIRRVQDAGFGNLTADLIYGFPLLSDEKWLQNVGVFTGLNIPHLSCYNLTVEEGTALSGFIRAGRQPPPSDEQGARQFLSLTEAMEQAGFLHYEISSFCREGAWSRHNTAYWQGTNYLGIGPSAHSFNGCTRSWNIRNNHRYAEGLFQGTPFFDQERLSEDDRANERIMTGLRTMWGVDLAKFEEDFGIERFSVLQKAASSYVRRGWAKVGDGAIRLTREGKLYADRIAADLFFAEER